MPAAGRGSQGHSFVGTPMYYEPLRLNLFRRNWVYIFCIILSNDPKLAQGQSYTLNINPHRE